MFNEEFENARRWQRATSRPDHFLRGLRASCQQINAGDGGFFAARRFVRPAARHLGVWSCPWRVSLCFAFVLAASLLCRGFVHLFFFFLARKEVKGILSKSGSEWEEKDRLFFFWRTCSMWRWSDRKWRLMRTINSEPSRGVQLHLLDLFPRHCFHLCSCIGVST